MITGKRGDCSACFLMQNKHYRDQRGNDRRMICAAVKN